MMRCGVHYIYEALEIRSPNLRRIWFYVFILHIANLMPIIIWLWEVDGDMCVSALVRACVCVCSVWAKHLLNMNVFAHSTRLAELRCVSVCSKCLQNILTKTETKLWNGIKLTKTKNMKFDGDLVSLQCYSLVSLPILCSTGFFYCYTQEINGLEISYFWTN